MNSRNRAALAALFVSRSQDDTAFDAAFHLL